MACSGGMNTTMNKLSGGEETKRVAKRDDGIKGTDGRAKETRRRELALLS